VLREVDLVHDLAHVFFDLQVGNVEGGHRLEREGERFVGRTSASLATGVLSRLTERAKDSRPIESLALTVIAVAHNRLYASESQSIEL
jgi:hypothetical protein